MVCAMTPNRTNMLGLLVPIELFPLKHAITINSVLGKMTCITSLLTYLLVSLIYFQSISSAHVPDNVALAYSSSVGVGTGHHPDSNKANELSPQLDQILAQHYTQMYSYNKRVTPPSTSSPLPTGNESENKLIHAQVSEFADSHLKNYDQLYQLIQQLNRDKVKNDYVNGKAINDDSKPSAEPQSQYQAPLEDKIPKPNYSNTEKLTPSENRNEQLNKHFPTQNSDNPIRLFNSEKNILSVTNSKEHGDQNPPGLHDMFTTLDDKLQKIQDSLYYFKTMTKYGFSSPTSNTGYTPHLSLFKSQFLNLENYLETKFSNVEHKLSNLEIEDGIWKKTINWKIDEISSKLAQSENKISFSSEQIMNKIDLLERNFKVVTNDFFAKFLLVNEKLNKIELNMQSKLNDFETKMNLKNLNYQQKLTNIFKQDIDKTGTEYDYFVANRDSNEASTKKPIDMKEEFTNRLKHMKQFHNYKANNVTQRLLKLISMKQNQATLNRTKFNATMFESLVNVTQNPVDHNMLSNDAPQIVPNTMPSVPVEDKIDKVSHSHDNYRQSGVTVNKSHIIGHNNRNLDAPEPQSEFDVAYKDITHLKSTSHSVDNIEQHAKCKKLLQLIPPDTNIKDIDQVITLCRNILQITDNPSPGSNKTEEREIVEKRDLDKEKFVIEQKKNKEPNSEKVTSMEDNVSQDNKDVLASTKLEELDSKLQFFSTKIINIVQEMWLLSKSSESYMKETLSIANKTNNMMKEEFGKIHSTMKPISKISNLAEEVQDPIINRLKEMYTAINNSVEVILNTQSQYISTFKSIREEEHYFELEMLFNEMRNKSGLMLQQMDQRLLEQNGQLNQSLESFMHNLDQIGKKTYDGVKWETSRLVDTVKSEMFKISQNSANYNAKQSLLASGEKHMDNSKSANQDMCNNECFITKDEFAHICINIESKLFDEPEKKPFPQSDARQQQHQTTPNKVANENLFFDPNNNTNIEINNGNSGNVGEINIESRSLIDNYSRKLESKLKRPNN